MNSIQALESNLIAFQNTTLQQLSTIVELVTNLRKEPISNNRVISSCRDISSHTSGIYRIDPEFPFREPMTVFCDQQYEGGGWTVIQRRIDGSVDFFRDWQEYKRGFGSLHGEFWLGLEQIYRLTNVAPHELVVLLEDFDGNTAVARYNQYRIEAESLNYTLVELGKCKPCSAGNSLSSHRNEQFSTYDRDNGKAKFNCAEAYRGGWWHFSCHHVHLNGKYLKGPLAEADDAQGIIWMKFRNSSLKASVMMIRPIK
ncbi:AGAP005848-PA-like protein [Anopheles sinensis]|uniref:AGAP005848-PA-like protein n=1 Tax=Anopheles sinensis TaxID=74873 RepID=A0A084WEC0_ANOSI|nr:AGAP005848-PA-like protein [Anopheles sinensis]